MLETKGMALMIFTALNALGVGFLLYVLAQFWIEGHKSRSAIRARIRVSVNSAWPQVVVVTTPITAETRPADVRVIRFPVRAGDNLQGRTREASRSAVR
jgi:hypothetical protein